MVTRVMIFALPLMLFTAPAAIAQSAGPEVIAVLDAAIQSLKEKPHQFHVTAMAVGMMGTATAPGTTGIRCEATGGGAGSTTTGCVSIVDTNTNVQLVERADARLKVESEKAIKLLSEIKTLVQAPKPDQPGIMTRLTDLANTYVPKIISEIITAAIKARFKWR
jgi:hypothetical protein